MAKRYPGLYMYYDWMEAVESLGPEPGFQLMINLYHYSKEGRKPMPLEGSANLIQNLCLAQLERSIKQSEAGTRGNQIKYGKTHPRKQDLPEILRDSDLYIDPEDDPEEQNEQED